MKFDREAAIDAAMHEIWRHGYEAASVNSLSEKLGITRSSFYNAFGSREELFSLVLDRYLSSIPEGELFTATAETQLAPLLTRVFRAACARLAKDPENRGCLAANCLAELLPADNPSGAAMAQLAHQTFDQLDQLVTWAVRRGELADNTDIRGTALALHSAIMGLNLQSKFMQSERDLWRSASVALSGLGLLYADHDPLAANAHR